MDQQPIGQSRRAGRLVRAVVAVGYTAAVFSAGYLVGQRGDAPARQLEQYSRLPPAKGFLNYPNEYRVDVRQNASSEREVYLLDLRRGLEIRLDDDAPRTLSANQGAGASVVSPAVRAVEAGRWLYRRLGGAPSGATPAVKKP